MNKVDVLVGLQRGDEAKGKIAKVLVDSGRYRNVCKFNGGSNAGHTVWIDDEKFVTHYLTAGVYDEKCNIVIGPGCVVNIDKLISEIEEFENAGIKIRDRLYITEETHIITANHLKKDSEEGGKIGTTGQGIGPAYVDKYKRVGDRFGHLSSFVCPIHVIRLSEFYIEPRTTFVGRTLMEGCQGFWLDIDHGTYPYVTSSNTLPQHAFTTFGIPMHNCGLIIGAAKMYETYSGSKEDMLICSTEDATKIQKKGDEFGATTGRPRKIGYLNLDDLMVAIKMTGVDRIVFSKGDILLNTKIFKLVESGNIRSFDEFHNLKQYIEDTIKLYDVGIKIKIFWSNDPAGDDLEYYDF